MSIASWALAVMLSWSPPETAVAHSFVPEAQESAEERTRRYLQIAVAIEDVVSEGAPLYSGPHGRHYAAAMLLGISYMESGWRRDVDLGIGKLARGSNLDSCLMQIRTDQEGHARLTADRRACFREGLAIVRRSISACRDLPREEKLAVYASGSCRSNAGKEASRKRIAIVRRMLDRFPPKAWP